MKDVLSRLPPEWAIRVDQACCRFEEAWKAGQPPRLEDYLCPSTDPAYPAMLRELILLDVHYRQQEGQAPRPTDYAERFSGCHFEWSVPSTVVPTDSSSTAQDPKNASASGHALAVAPAPGSRLGNFELLAELGRGGMGVVYKARQVHPDRLVALKVIRPDMVNHLPAAERERWIARFRDEAAAVATLDHPHIITLYEVGTHEGAPYFSMKYVEGGSLLTHLKTHPLQSPDALDSRKQQRQAAGLIAAAARAVHHAHQRGILHRDLTPGNILLGEEGQPLVTDFGLAKRLDQDASLPSGIVGVPSFMAPEQAAGRRGAVAVPADVYSLGAILYLLLTGRPPFHGDNAMETLLQVMESEPGRPRDLQPAVDRDLETICLKCLRKEPGQRYGSAEALADDLDNWLAGRPINARPVGPLERAMRWSRRNPVLAGLIGAVVLLLGGITLLSTLSAQQLRETLDIADKAKVAEGQAKQDAQHKLWGAYVSEAEARRTSGRRGQRFESLKAIRAALLLPLPPGRSRDELRNAAIAALCLPDIEAGPEWDREAQKNPPNVYAFEQYANYEALWARVPEPKFPPRGQRYSSDGRLVLAALEPYLSNKQMTVAMRLYRKDGADLRPVRDDLGVYEEASGYSPSNRQVALGHPDGTVSVYDTLSGKELRRLKVESGRPFCLAFHPTLPRLAVGAGNQVTLFDLDARVLQRLAHPNAPFSIAWRPDGRQLAVGCEDKGIYLWDAESGQQVIAPWRGHEVEGIRLSFNGTGDRVVSNDWQSHLRLWDARTGREIFYTPEVGYQYDAARPGLLGPIGSVRKLQFLRVAEGHELRQIYQSVSTLKGPIYLSPHPEGRLHATTGVPGLGFFNLATGEALAIPPVKDTDSVTFDDSGAMWTANAGALYRWPVRLVAAPEAVYEIGPPDRVADNFPRGTAFTIDKAGQVLVIPQFNHGALVLLRNEGNRRVKLQPQYDVRFTAVSPDGRWVATGSHEDDGKGVFIKIWQSSSGRLVKELPEKLAHFLYGFSPDGRWLITASSWEGFSVEQRAENFLRLWEVGTWRESGTIPTLGKVFWDQDIVVEGQRDGTMLMTQISTRKELARFSSPEPGRVLPEFLLRSGYLLGRGEDGRVLYVWDLLLIRAQLREMGLDWDGPPVVSDREKNLVRTPYAVRVNAGSLAK